MTKERLAAFSDGVIAIIITIMVLELHSPHGADWHALKPLLPTLLSYVLSFTYVAIYWNNHHHLLYVTDRVNGAVLWANMHLLFWLSLTPFTTRWLGGTNSAPTPTALYGIVLLMAAIAYMLLQRAILNTQGCNSTLARAVGHDGKGKISPILYTVGIAVSFVAPWIADALYIIVALIWLVPDRRIEKILEAQSRDESGRWKGC